MIKINLSKKILIIISFVAIMLGIIFIIISGRKEIKNEKETIEVFPASLICVQTGKDEDQNEFINKVYLNYDEDENITEVIYQMVTTFEGPYFNTETDFINSILDIYNSVTGIHGYTKIIDNQMITTIKYDYLKINLQQIKKDLKDFLDEESIFYKIKNLPIQLSFFKKNELATYSCASQKDAK